MLNKEFEHVVIATYNVILKFIVFWYRLSFDTLYGCVDLWLAQNREMLRVGTWRDLPMTAIVTEKPISISSIPGLKFGNERSSKG